jgi:hypothetical protein
VRQPCASFHLSGCLLKHANFINLKLWNPINLNRKDWLIGLLFMGWMMLLGYSFGGGAQPSDEVVKTRLLNPKASTGAMPNAGLPPAMENRIDTVWMGGTPTEQMALSSSWDTVTDPEEIKRLLDNVDRLPANISKECARAALLKSWVKMEPGNAIRWCQTHSVKLLPRLMETWAAADIEAVRSKAMTTGDNNHAALMARSVLKGLADTDPREALGFLSEIAHRLEDNESSLMPAIGKLARIDPALLLDAAENASREIRRKCRAAAATEMARNDPAYAIKWSSTQSDKRDLMTAVCKGLDSAYWGDALAASVDSGGSVSFVYDWARKDPKNVLELVLGMGIENSGFESSAAYAVRTIYSKGDSETIRWLESLSDGKVNEIAAEARGRLDSKTKGTENPPPPMTAKALVSSKDMSSSSFFRLPTDERGKIADAVRQLPGKDAVEFVDELLSSGTSLPFKTSTDLLAAIAPNADAEETSKRIVSLVKRVASKWGELTPEETAMWAESLPPGAVRMEAVKAVAQQWAAYDEVGARQWKAANTLPKLPNE